MSLHVVLPFSPASQFVHDPQRLSGHAAPARPRPALARHASDLSLAAVARRLRLDHHASRTIVSKLRVLVEASGFPLPRNPRIVRGKRLTGPKSVCAASVWDRDEVELWLEGDQPPPAAAAAERSQGVRDQLAARARAMLQSGTLEQAERVVA
jgi:hypothetical protein